MRSRGQCDHDQCSVVCITSASEQPDHPQTLRPHRAPAQTRATRWGAFTTRDRAWAASMSLNPIARPAAREPDVGHLIRARLAGGWEDVLRPLRILTLRDGEVHSLDVARAMRPGANNVIRVTSHGPRSATTLLVVSGAEHPQ